MTCSIILHESEIIQPGQSECQRASGKHAAVASSNPL